MAGDDGSLLIFGDMKARAVLTLVNALTARLFGVYTLVVSLIRGYAAYNIHIAA